MNRGAQEPAGCTHPDQTSQADDNGPPLHHELFQAEHGPHMDQQQKQAQCSTKRQQNTIGNQIVRQDKPVAQQH